jgi:hypothetical protein
MNIKPSVKRDSQGKQIVNFDLRPIITKVKQAINSFKIPEGAYSERPNKALTANILISVTGDVRKRPIVITIKLSLVNGPPDGGPPPHPPKKAFLVE